LEAETWLGAVTLAVPILVAITMLGTPHSSFEAEPTLVAAARGVENVVLWAVGIPGFGRSRGSQELGLVVMAGPEKDLEVAERPFLVHPKVAGGKKYVFGLPNEPKNVQLSDSELDSVPKLLLVVESLLYVDEQANLLDSRLC
jgi:hypothetical protein